MLGNYVRTINGVRYQIIYDTELTVSIWRDNVCVKVHTLGSQDETEACIDGALTILAMLSKDLHPTEVTV